MTITLDLFHFFTNILTLLQYPPESMNETRVFLFPPAEGAALPRRDAPNCQDVSIEVSTEPSFSLSRLMLLKSKWSGYFLE